MEKKKNGMSVLVKFPTAQNNPYYSYMKKCTVDFDPNLVTT